MKKPFQRSSAPSNGDHKAASPYHGLPTITGRTVVMAILVAMGGFIFGYDTGQISGFLEMPVFLQRFGQPTTDLATYPTGYRFSNVRSGLIVGLVSFSPL